MIRVALPTGDLREPLAGLLSTAGLSIPGYGEGSRSYRFEAESVPQVDVRVFRERDIPVQIAMGNYDVGICGLAHVEERLYRFPQEELVRLRDLEIGAANLYVVTAGRAAPTSSGRSASLRIVSEFPNLAEALAQSLRLPAYRVLPVWGSAERYPPEDAELALVAAPDEDAVRGWGLEPLANVLAGCACVIANRRSLGKKNLTPVLNPLFSLGRRSTNGGLSLPRSLAEPDKSQEPVDERDVVRLAVPDGHQQRDAVAALRDAGISLEGYDDSSAVARPRSNVEGLEVKVIRPQDMPQQVALGSFDLAITGWDWFSDHTMRFPSSPIRAVVDLGRCRYTLVACVSEDVPGDTLSEAISYWMGHGRKAIRLASEYANLADFYARDRHLGRYQVIPISGASEGFVPEDAEILIEGTETGTTIAANRLKVVDDIMQSTSHLIAGPSPPKGRRGELFEELVGRFQMVAGAAPTGGS